MAKPLPLDEQVISAAKLAVRAHVHCHLWWTTAHDEGRNKYRDALDEHWAAWRFVEHAQFIAYTVTIHNLFGDRHGTIRFRKLSHDLGGVGASEISAAQPIADKVRNFRDQLFAHRSDKLSYSEVFGRAAITGNELIELADASVNIAGMMVSARGLPEVPVDAISIDEMANILAKLQQLYRSQDDFQI